MAPRADAIARNPVAIERPAGRGVDRNPGRRAADWAGAEIAVAFRQRRHLRDARAAAVLEVPLETSEDEQLVLKDWTADKSAEIIPLQLALGLVVFLEEVVRGVERVVTDEVEPAAAELVRAAAGHDVDLRAAGAAELGAVAVAENLELLDGFERGVHQHRGVSAEIVVVCTVHGPQVRRHTAAADRQESPSEQPLVLDVEEIVLAHARHERRQLHEVAPVERELARLLAGDDARDVTADHLDGRGRRLYGHYVVELPRLEREVHHVVVCDTQNDPRARSRLEPLQLRGDPIAADWQIGKRVGPGNVRRGGAGQAGVVILRGDGRTGDEGR